MKPVTSVLLALVVAAALGLWFWQRGSQPPEPEAGTEAPLAVAPPAPPSAAASGTGDDAPPQFPIAAASAPEVAPSAVPAEPDLGEALAALLGRETLLSLVITDGFVNRTVATVDNLGRSLAPARMRPLVQPEGRFTVQATEGGDVIAAANHARYERHVGLLSRLDPARAAALYKADYARFQRAYEELGFPRRYFNDRLVQVIDLLLATPEPTGAVRVDLPEVQGPTQPVRPWVLYEFSEPELRPLRVGQKILLRMSAAQRAAVKAWLSAFRAQVT